DDGVAADARSRGVLLRRLPARRLGLRARVTLAFALGAAMLSAILSFTTFAIARSNLLSQRESTSLAVAYRNAFIVAEQLPLQPEQARDALASLGPAGSNPILVLGGVWTPFNSAFGEDALPLDVRQAVLTEGRAVRMRYGLPLDGTPRLAIGIPLPERNAAYFEIVSLEEIEDTLGTLGVSLLGASVLTTAAGAAVGWWASRRALRPLTDVSQAAQAIAGGRLDTRLEGVGDPDLGPLATSFNDMAQALQDRIERDARFASDVSHELRSPLMTMSAAVDVLANQRELPERSRQAVELVEAEIDRFRQLVEDLLEMSRYDAGAVRLDRDDIRLAEFVLQAVGASGHRNVPIELDAELAGVIVSADKRRLARVIANLLDNAAKYGDGATVVALRKVDHAVQMVVEDEGPGVPPEERDLIFNRFARGGLAGRRGTSEGVGLGLALVAEHVRLHGGRVWVDDREDGRPGSRFVVELPAGPA
ncbi:MAG: ATP-binding protein, partial [Acidimicrobiales bacterium]